MAMSEVDNFVRKFKNLLLAGKHANLTIKSQTGKVLVTLTVEEELLDVVPVKSRNGPSRQRRRARRAAVQAAAGRVAADNAADESVAVEAEPFKIAAEEAAKKVFELEDQARDYRNIIAKASEIALEKEEANSKEVEEYRDTIAVQEMLHDNFKERMTRKYNYNDEIETDGSENEEDIFQCKECSFVGKNENGLKIHVSRMHRTRLNSL